MPAASASVTPRTGRRAGAQRAHGGQHGAQQQRAAADAASAIGASTRAPPSAQPRADGERMPGAPAGAGEPDAYRTKRHEHAEREEREAEHVALALLEHGQAQARDRARRFRGRRRRACVRAGGSGTLASGGFAARERALRPVPSRATSTPGRRNLPAGLTIALARPLHKER